MAATTCTHLHVYSRARQSGHALISYESPACALCKKVDSVRGKAGYGCKARGTEKQKPLCTSGEQPRQEERKSKIHNKVTHTHTHRTRLYSYSASGVSNHLVNGEQEHRTHVCKQAPTSSHQDNQLVEVSGM
eukprot:scaffold214204_cov26-Tisochrysis_lutea.AAC.1